MPESENLEKHLKELTQIGELYEPLDDGKLECYACAHLCKISEGKSGVCRVRYHQDGTMRVPFGYVAGLQCDPIEKKPFFHVMPGKSALSFGMLGCDLKCPYCQNWISSQTLKDPSSLALPEKIEAKKISQLALKHHAPIVVSTYNEPLITSEWAVAVFREAKQSGLKTGYISNGNANERVLQYLKPWLDLYKVDLKSFDEKHYHRLGGQLKKTLQSIQLIYAMGFWIEVVTLIVPGFNDSDDELKKIAEFLSSISPYIPWHVTAFHSNYKMQDHENTSVSTLLRAVDIGKKSGLHYVYAGNKPGSVGTLENTYCHQCHTLLVERLSFSVLNMNIKNGKCPNCKTKIPGVWG